MVADNTPVIIGSAQLVDREATVEQHIEPLEMLLRTARQAGEDAGLTAANLEELDTVAMVGVSGWHPQNAPELVAQKLGAHAKNLYSTGIGGQMGVQLTNFLADKILAKESEFAIVSGCNNLRVLMKAIAQKTRLNWTRGGEGEPIIIGGDDPGNNDIEKKYGLLDPPDIYPLFENALRANLGLSIDDHNNRLGNLFSAFTEVAANNPYAWLPIKRSCDELTTVTPNNRMIVWPYPKYLNAIMNTEQAASLLIMSAGKARKLGIPEEKWVYWHGGAHSQEEAYWPSERPDFASCPSMKDTLYSAMKNSHATMDEINHIDFYSCFPVAVEMACKMGGLDIDDNRGFTVTGGLPYAGGPASAYTLHSLATMATMLRGKSSLKGLVTGNGWYLTKHAATVLSSDPHPGGTPRSGLIDELPSKSMETAACVVNEQATGSGVVEAYTVKYNRDGSPETGIVLGKTDSGDRFLANTTADKEFLNEFVKTEQVGSSGILSIVDGKSLFVPN